MQALLKKQEFKDFLAKLAADAETEYLQDGQKWPKAIGLVVTYYRSHATASLQELAYKKIVTHADGAKEVADMAFLKLMEREGPVDDLFAVDFRAWATRAIDPFSDRGQHEESLCTTILRDCAERYLIRTFTKDARIDYKVPDRPLVRLANHPFKSKLRNQVLIEELLPPSDCRALVPVQADPEPTVLADAFDGDLVEENNREWRPVSASRFPYINIDKLLRHPPSDGKNTIEFRTFQQAPDADEIAPVVFKDDQAPPDDLKKKLDEECMGEVPDPNIYGDG
jgi:hypothetical protein